MVHILLVHTFVSPVQSVLFGRLIVCSDHGVGGVALIQLHALLFAELLVILRGGCSEFSLPMMVNSTIDSISCGTSFL